LLILSIYELWHLFQNKVILFFQNPEEQRRAEDECENWWEKLKDSLISYWKTSKTQLLEKCLQNSLKQ